MNIGTSTTFQRPSPPPALTRRQGETALSYDNSERRMEHSSFQPNHILNSFWDVVQRLPRQDQMSLAANVMASQFAQNGMTRENRDFLRSFKNRFTPDEINGILDQVKQHPLLKKEATGKKDEFLRIIQEVLEVPPALKVQDQLTPVPGRPLPRSPEEIFFQMSLRPRAQSKETRVEAVSQGN